MARYFRNQGKKVGAPPGFLNDLRLQEGGKTTLSLMNYNEKILFEKVSVVPDDCPSYLSKPATVTWINAIGVRDPKIMEKLGQVFSLHPLILEDILGSSERPKMEMYPDSIFIVTRLLEVGGNLGVADQQVSLIIGPNYVLSFFEHPSSIIEPILERLRQGNNRIRSHGADYLAYALIDAVVDHTFIVLRQFDENLEALEEELIARPTNATVAKIHKMKREMAFIRQSIWPTREVISQFRRLESPLVKSETQLFMHDVYDHTIQAIETIEGLREIVGGMLDIYLSSISQRLNEIMKVLTVVATTFAPLTFLTGFYGMNFDYIPGMHTHWGFAILMITMILTVVGMLAFFRKRKWI